MRTDKYDNLSIGTAGLAGIWGEIEECESIETILYALEKGIYCFDTAPAYRNAEQLLGKALKQWNGSKPFVSTKCGRLKSENPEINLYDFTEDAIKRSLESSLEIIGVNHIDVLFLHDPSAIKLNQIEKTISCLKSIKEKGLAKEIGIGGNYSKEFEPYIDEKVFSVFMGYNRFNVITQDALEEEYKFLSNKNIKIWQASPLYNGLLGSNYNTYKKNKPNWISDFHLNKADAFYSYCRDNNTTMPEMAIRYIRSSNAVNKIIIGAKNMIELQDSIEYWEKDTLTDETIKEINQLF